MSNCDVIKMTSSDSIHGCVKWTGMPQVRHWHSDVEFVFVKKGRITIEVDSNVIKPEEGWLIIIPSNVIHTFLGATDNSTVYIARIPIKDFYLLKHLQSEAVIQLYSRYLLVISPPHSFTDIITQLMFADYKEYNQLYVFSKVMDLTVQLLAAPGVITKKIDVKAAESSEVAIKIREFIDAHLFQQISLPMLAEHLGFSETYCSRIIRKKTNVGFLDYINHLRIGEAIELLQKTDMSITDICHAVGFNSVASFNRNFKKFRGVSPTEFRKGKWHTP
ncbi:MAG: AraC family transcriptional regulator [Firmicutes bacterium]|nr:AraC family transcriptional regulator [Bacillota bacterium]